jgi:hypothetical protein
VMDRPSELASQGIPYEFNRFLLRGRAASESIVDDVLSQAAPSPTPQVSGPQGNESACPSTSTSSTSRKPPNPRHPGHLRLGRSDLSRLDTALREQPRRPAHAVARAAVRSSRYFAGFGV